MSYAIVLTNGKTHRVIERVTNKGAAIRRLKMFKNWAYKNNKIPKGSWLELRNGEKHIL